VGGGAGGEKLDGGLVVVQMNLSVNNYCMKLL